MTAVGLTLLVLAFAAFLLLRVPIAFGIGLATLIGLIAATDTEALSVLAQRMSAGVNSFPLLAIPLFVLAGHIMGASGTARRLIDAAGVLVGRLPGGLSLVNVLSCMLFGAISGSAGAAISSIGGVTIPALEEDGEDRAYATALCTTSATTGLLIPPSNAMIVYAVVAQTSVAGLFFAGVGPGILMGVLIMIAALWLRQMHMRGRTPNNTVEQKPRSFSEGLVTIGLAAPSLVLVVAVLGGILTGTFSATEAAAMAVLFALLIGQGERIVQKIRREHGESLTWTKLPVVLRDSAKTTAIVMFLIAASQALSWTLSYLRVPQEFAEALVALTDNPIALLLLMNLTLLIVGTFLDMTPAILIFTPIFLPVAESAGLHPAHFGVVMILNLCIGLCTPPVGGCLFIGCSVGKVSIGQVTRPMLPFIATMIVALALTTAIAPISMWLPERLGLIDTSEVEPSEAELNEGSP